MSKRINEAAVRIKANCVPADARTLTAGVIMSTYHSATIGELLVRKGIITLDEFESTLAEALDRVCTEAAVPPVVN